MIIVVGIVAVEVVNKDNSCDIGGNGGDSSVISCSCWLLVVALIGFVFVLVWVVVKVVVVV